MISPHVPLFDEMRNTARFLDFLQWVLKKTALPENPRVLEFGCRQGDATRLVAAHLRGRGHIVAVDPFSKAIRAARERTDAARFPRIEYRITQAESLPFPDATFDFAFCARALIHVEHPANALKEIARVLKPEAQFLGVEVDFASYSIAQVEQLYSESLRLNPYIARELAALCRAAGLTPTDVFPNFMVSREPLTREMLEQKKDGAKSLRPRLRHLDRLEFNSYITETALAVQRQTKGAVTTLLEVAVLARKE
jgi:ubiquinone/menaquinone biosynthesis C-methylase UbiE